MKKHLVSIRHEHGAQSSLWAVIFAVTFVAAVVVDLAGLLQYAGVVGGLPLRILEIGGIITAAAILPLIVMGMSISNDFNRKR
ncbi:MAG TPA: hypothetical protein VFW22_17885 [Pseudolabrys sp.]|nr:hypothetical protein [Pseudolabrys sp.]